MATRRPDYILIAAMELWGGVPQPVAKCILDCYKQPAPLTYDAAVELVKGKFLELVASGALEGTEAAPEPKLPVVRSVPNSQTNDEHEHECDGSCGFGDRHPPFWWLDAYQGWSIVMDDD